MPDGQHSVSNGYSAMRTALIALGIVAIGLLAIAAIVDWQRVEVPPVGPSVERTCAEAMERAPADLSWVAPNRAEKVRGREIKAVTLGELPGHAGGLAGQSPADAVGPRGPGLALGLRRLAPLGRRAATRLITRVAPAGVADGALRFPAEALGWCGDSRAAGGT